jgi:hypothetical protein
MGHDRMGQLGASAPFGCQTVFSDFAPERDRQAKVKTIGGTIGIESMTSLAPTDMAPMRAALIPPLLLLLDGTKLTPLPGNGEVALYAGPRLIHGTRECERV